MEAYIVAVEAAAQDAGEDVLAGMLLHMVKAPGPVQFSGDDCSDFQGFVHIVENHAVFFVHIRDGRAAQRAVVGRLSAALWVKGGAAQHGGIAVFAALAVQHGGGEALQKGVGIV